MNVTVATKAPRDKMAAPEIPCPEVQPPPHRAPNPMNIPPTKRTGTMTAIGSRLPSAPYVKLGDGPPLRKAAIN